MVITRVVVRFKARIKPVTNREIVLNNAKNILQRAYGCAIVVIRQ